MRRTTNTGVTMKRNKVNDLQRGIAKSTKIMGSYLKSNELDEQQIDDVILFYKECAEVMESIKRLKQL